MTIIIYIYAYYCIIIYDLPILYVCYASSTTKKNFYERKFKLLCEEVGSYPTERKEMLHVRYSSTFWGIRKKHNKRWTNEIELEWASISYCSSF